MPEFQHLNLVRVIERKPFNAYGGGPPKGEKAIYNLEHRQEHFDLLTDQVRTVQESWSKEIETRRADGLPELENEHIIPVFLQLDLAKDIESLKSFGIEIISEEEDGYIIGANSEGFETFTDRLEQFLNRSDKRFQDAAAGVLEVITEPSERLKRIVAADLLSKWELLEDVPEIVVYIAISSYLKAPDYPQQGPKQSDESYQASIEGWKTRYRQWEIEKDDLARTRENAFENFIRPYNGVFIGSVGQYSHFDDGFGTKIRISGRGLKDLALRFAYVFAIEEHDPLLSFRGSDELESLLDVEVQSPAAQSARICVIDSGIQEGHRLLASAIDGTMSISYVPNDTDTFDKVPGGGHGTRVAGAVLFPSGIMSTPVTQQAPFWIQNARILDDQNMLSSQLDEADLMRIIVDRFTPTRIFNLSVSHGRPTEYIHMPIWSAAIDQIIWKNDVLFIIAAGNIPKDSTNPDIPGVMNYLSNGLAYPDFLKEVKSKITNPAYSCFSLAVGSISDTDFENTDHKCIGEKDHPSSFSRSGLGLWGMIKPDVVEYGGDFVLDKLTGRIVSVHEGASPKLIRSTRDNGPGVGNDMVGTSFTTPKVAHIAGILQNLYPAESTLLYRALIVQSAKIPASAHNIMDFICHYGYGIPSLENATTNSPKRVSLYSSGFVNPKNSNIYLVKIPAEVTRPGYDIDVLIEITLSFKAEPRITRRKTSSYLSAWLDWETSRRGDTQQTFAERILKHSDVEEDEEGQKESDDVDRNDPTATLESFKWTIASKGKDGLLKGVKRQDSSVQKDWCIVKSNKLPDEFLIAVKGHKGWEKDLDKELPYSIVVSFELLDTEAELDIYNLIRIENEIEVNVEQRIETGM